MLEAVFADETQQSLEIRNLNHAGASESSQRIVGELAFSHIAVDRAFELCMNVQRQAGPGNLGCDATPLGEVIRLWGGGGGGFGEPFERDPEMVAADVAAGLVSPERAREIYGVAVANGAVDAKATATLRGPQRDIGGDSLGGFDFGLARTEWERVHGLAAERIAAWLPGLPVAVRRYAQADVYRRLHETGPGPYKADAVAVALTEVGAALGAQTSAVVQNAAQ